MSGPAAVGEVASPGGAVGRNGCAGLAVGRSLRAGDRKSPPRTRRVHQGPRPSSPAGEGTAAEVADIRLRARPQSDCRSRCWPWPGRVAAAVGCNRTAAASSEAGNYSSEAGEAGNSSEAGEEGAAATVAPASSAVAAVLPWAALATSAPWGPAPTTPTSSHATRRPLRRHSAGRGASSEYRRGSRCYRRHG